MPAPASLVIHGFPVESGGHSDVPNKSMESSRGKRDSNFTKAMSTEFPQGKGRASDHWACLVPECHMVSWSRSAPKHWFLQYHPDWG